MGRVFFSGAGPRRAPALGSRRRLPKRCHASGTVFFGRAMSIREGELRLEFVVDLTAEPTSAAELDAA